MNMGSACSIFLLVVCLSLNAQNEERTVVKNTIDTFFKAFHNRDSTAMRKNMDHEIILQTVGKDKNQNEQLSFTNYDNFIRSIASIPDSVRFEEKLLDYTIQIDGPMAQVWTPYEFWLNDTFHHCGVNSFQLFRKNGHWKIIYLIDTRRTNNCNQE